MRILGKFLQTFAAFTSVLTKVTNKGPNNLIPIFIEHELVQALAAADTVALTVPFPPLQADYAVVLEECFAPSITNVRTSKKSLLSVTSYNKATGVVTLTSTGVVPITSVILLKLLPCSDSAAS